MIGIRIDNTFLDLYGNTSITFDLNTPVFLGEDVEVLPGSFSFPINLPATTRNVRTLGYPQVEDNEDRFRIDEPCEVLVDGNVLFRGRLTVRSASFKTIRIYILINERSQRHRHQSAELQSHFLSAVQPGLFRRH